MRALGCKEPLIAPHLVRMSFRMHMAMAMAAVAAFDQRQLVDVSGHPLLAAVKDQGNTSSCEGHSSSGATESAFNLLGIPLGVIPSEDELYKGARSIQRARATPGRLTLPTLTDDGANTEDIIAFLAEFGVRGRRVSHTSDGRNSDVEESTVNDELKLDELEESMTRIIIGPHAIDPHANDTEEQVKAAIASKIPVRVDAFVDSAFEAWSRGDKPVPAPDTRDPHGGGHAIYIVGYTPDYYIIRNSWGVEWGEGGDVHVSPAWLRKSWGLYPWTVKRGV